jgi:two-component system, LytTR family, sensor kinase
MEPDFIFNTLNSVTSLVRANRNAAAVSAIVTLSGFLRRAFQQSNRPLVPLAEEVTQLVCYLDLQKIRFADRLQVSIDIPVELFESSVPFLVLQPLVENAIRHGIAKSPDGGMIRVAGFRRSGRLRLSIYNDGPCLPPDWVESSAGVGLSNLRMRLKMLYGTEFLLIVRNRDARGVEALVSVPLQSRK